MYKRPWCAYTLLGLALRPKVVGRDAMPGKSHYFVGNDPKKWHVGVPHFAKVAYHEVYAGVDLVYYGHHG